MQCLQDRQMPIGAMQRVANMVRTTLLTGVGGWRFLLNRIVFQNQTVWFVDLGNEDENAAKLVFHDGDEKFNVIFSGMKRDSVALVIDLTSALQRMRNVLQ
jgi:hypothetical protein